VDRQLVDHLLEEDLLLEEVHLEEDLLLEEVHLEEVLLETILEMMEETLEMMMMKLLSSRPRKESSKSSLRIDDQHGFLSASLELS